MTKEISVDLRSDTKTKPTDAMRDAMFAAEVGDEQSGEDPTCNALLEEITQVLGKPAAIFLPSGTMANSIAVQAQCERGSRIILDRSAHMHFVEAPGLAAVCGVRTLPIEGKRGMFTGEQAVEAMNSPNPYPPGNSLLAIEQTTNLGGGAIWPLETMQEVCTLAHREGLRTHLDGARLFNAVVATGIAPSEYSAPFDSVMISLTKGLGAPFGVVLAGSEQLVERAWMYKHLYGGAMRQVGSLAAAGLYALQYNVERLAQDHEHAKLLACGLAEMPGITVDPNDVATNIVLFDVSALGLSAGEFCERMREYEVGYFAISENLVRAVTHLHIDRGCIQMALQATALLVQRLSSGWKPDFKAAQDAFEAEHGLVPLVVRGTQMQGWAVVSPKSVRQAVVEELLPHVEREALLEACNRHLDARWWAKSRRGPVAHIIAQEAADIQRKRNTVSSV